jgi:hypothetical protein
MATPQIRLKLESYDFSRLLHLHTSASSNNIICSQLSMASISSIFPNPYCKRHSSSEKDTTTISSDAGETTLHISQDLICDHSALFIAAFYRPHAAQPTTLVYLGGKSFYFFSIGWLHFDQSPSWSNILPFQDAFLSLHLYH